MKKKNFDKVMIVLTLLIAFYIAGHPYVSVVLDRDFGLAVSTRISAEHKFEPLFVYRFER